MKQLLFFLFCLISYPAFSQKGSISGKIANEAFQPVHGVRITILKNDSVVTTTYTDSNGIYTTMLMDTGLYVLHTLFPFYRNVVVNNVPVKPGEITPFSSLIEPRKKHEKDFIKDYTYYYFKTRPRTPQYNPKPIYKNDQPIIPLIRQSYH